MLFVILASQLFVLFNSTQIARAANANTIQLNGTDCTAHIFNDGDFSDPMTERGVRTMLSGNNSSIITGEAFFGNTDYGSFTSPALQNKIKIKGSPEEKLANMLLDSLAGTRPNVTYIAFSAGSNPGNDQSGNGADARCLRGLRLFQDPANGVHFFGWKYDDNSNGSVLQDGTYDPATKRITISGTSLPFVHNGDFQTDAEVQAILSSTSLNPGAGGGGGGGGGPTGNTDANDPCAGQKNNADRYSECNAPRFTDANTIRWKNEVFTLVKWAGSGESFQNEGMRYYLTQANEITHHKVDNIDKPNQVPYIQIKTDGNGAGSLMPFNIDKWDASLKEFVGAVASADNLAYWDRHVHYVDFDSHGNTNATTGSPDTITMQNVENLRKFFTYYSASKTIGVNLGQTRGANETHLIVAYAQLADNPKIFNAPSIFDSCSTKPPYIELSADPTTATTAQTIDGTWHFPAKSDCSYPSDLSSPILIQVAPSALVYTPPADAADNPAAANTAEAKAPITCNTTWKNAISWILCPVIGLAEELTDKVQSIVAGFLFIKLDAFNGNTKDSSANGLYNAWNSIRQISTVIIVIIALIMIFSEAMGAGIMNNYSVKKILPRLIFAGIAIQLSWVFTKELINIANIFGNGIEGLLLAPFGGAVKTDLLTLIDPNKLSGASGAGLSFAVVVGGAVSIGAIGTIAIGLIIALIIAFVTLILRYMVIILCIMFAPIAIALSVLPGTQKVSKLWWESLSKALIMYPIIMAMFAAGKIVAYGLIQAGTNDTTQKGWFVLAAIVGYFLPYALLPAALKAGGTALNKVSGAFNDKGKGVFEKARSFDKKRKEVAKQNSLRKAFDPNAGKIRRVWGAKDRAGAYLAAGAVGRGTKFERGGIRVKGAQEAAQRRLFNEKTALTELEVKEAQTASDRSYTNASIDSLGDKGLRQSHYVTLAKLENGQKIKIGDTEFTGSWAVREKALTSMLKNKMLDNTTTSTGAFVPGLSAVDPKTGTRSGVMSDLAASSSPNLLSSLNSFKNGNFSDVKNAMPDEIDPSTNLFGLGADKIPELDKTRLARWREQAAEAITTADVPKKQDLLRQVNDLARRGAPKALTDELIGRVRTVDVTLADNMDKVVSSRGNTTFDPTDHTGATFL
jgi:hypothetical protein